MELDERTVKSIAKLYDVSLVTYPAYKDTEASVREHPELIAVAVADIAGIRDRNVDLP